MRNDGYLTVPQRPVLGLELDEEAFRRARERSDRRRSGQATRALRAWETASVTSTTPVSACSVFSQ